MKKVYIGSQNPVKIKATKEILEPLGYEVISMDVESGVSFQPLSDEETMRGALNRALNLPKGSIRIGLEAGVQNHLDKLFLVNWGALVDEFDVVYWAGGTRIPLPDSIKSALIEEHYELSFAMEVYFHKKNIKHQEGAIGFFTDNHVCRHDIFTHIVRLLIGQYLKQKNEEEIK